ncbi:HEAT repeat domain-containing protein [Rhodococcus sp. MEB064]|uniref:HEAT repeat domain-containing protein n=1 Tax=Rhodococcus sp. MEB064 TaxID=1587522 RepID=UPI0018CE53FF|nr:HEAT repeat domain-containing protein [Rhodococcus sp. MEB064]
MSTTTDRNLSAEAPQFDYELLVCQDFDAILRGGSGRAFSLAGFITVVAEAGRGLIQASGGSGKTTMLKRLGREAAAAGSTVVELDALVWANRYEASKLAIEAAPNLLTLAGPLRQPNNDGLSDKYLLLIDGLNEVGNSLATVLLDQVDRLASQRPDVAIVLTDRLHRRRISAQSWVLATLSPVSNSQIGQLLKDTSYESDKTLRLPYYLDLALRGDRGTRSESHRKYLVNHGGVKPETLDALAFEAYSQYELNGNRGVNIIALSDAIGASNVEALIVAGTVVLEPTSRFAHHLVHDFLAATYAAANSDLWGSDLFDTITFKATSMDALAMVLEQSKDHADLLIRKVYDWNFYGAASLIAEDRRNGSNVSGAMEFVVIALLGERRFDPFASTVNQVTDALHVMRSDFSAHVLSSPSKEALYELVVREASSVETAGWLPEWIELFTQMSTANVTVQDVSLIAGSDSVLGWTMSNVLRRGAIAKGVELILIGLAISHESMEVRWRAVHALGASPTNDAVDALLQSLDGDVSTWVRYGSVRSLVEIALFATAMRSRIIAELSTRISTIRLDPQLTKELERVLLPRNVSVEWAEDSALLVETLWSQSESVEEQDRWRKLGSSIQASIGLVV